MTEPTINSFQYIFTVSHDYFEKGVILEQGCPNFFQWGQMKKYYEGRGPQAIPVKIIFFLFA